ncbi:DUF4345 family protein [uncultured Roseobacter sp.]|uniref:DUF4345 family protein n=1 Tax=uncultured Roseobacter sp. TaxID=114847 RepID=UPI00261D424E|nr:DUF4345 family protein [uncultured Roseobacter sp.]
MDIVTGINISLALISIALGIFGWLAPRYTMSTIDLRDGGSTMGMSEVRAASGALYVLAGIGALALNTPDAYAMIGFIWAGGAIGRLTSLMLDGQSRKKWVFLICETIIGMLGLGLNL